jgi:hypothetical protein
VLSKCRYIKRNSGRKRKRKEERKTPGRKRKRKEERKRP